MQFGCYPSLLSCAFMSHCDVSKPYWCSYSTISYAIYDRKQLLNESDGAASIHSHHDCLCWISNNV